MNCPHGKEGPHMRARRSTEGYVFYSCRICMSDQQRERLAAKKAIRLIARLPVPRVSA